MIVFRDDINGPGAPHSGADSASIEVTKVAGALGLSGKFGWGANARLTGKSGAVHTFDLVITPAEGGSAKAAVLRSVSEDMVTSIMLFNSAANDCGISRKVLAVDRDLDHPEANLARMYDIVIVDQRQHPERMHDIFGVGGLDEALGSSIRKGNIYMISGKTGAGKTVASTQFLVEGAKKGEKGMIIISDTHGADFIANAKTLIPGFEEYRKEGAIEVMELSREIRELKEGVLGNLKNRTRYIDAVTNEIKRLVSEYGITRLVIDPITPLIVADEDFINQFMMALYLPNAYTLVTSPVMKSDMSMYGMEEYSVSGLIKLEIPDVNAGIRKASIVKMRGGFCDTGPVYFRIAPGGMVPLKNVDKKTADEVFRRI